MISIISIISMTCIDIDIQIYYKRKGRMILPVCNFVRKITTQK